MVNSVTILSIMGVLLLWNEYLESKIVFLIGLIFIVFSFYISKIKNSIKNIKETGISKFDETDLLFIGD